MKIDDIVNECADTLAHIAELEGIPALVEEKGDVENELQLRLGQQDIAIMVGWNGFTPKKQSADEIIGDVSIIFSIFERPTVNRDRDNAKTIGHVAQILARELTYAATDGMDAPLFLKSISPIQSLSDSKDGGSVVCFVEFSTTAEL